jgi:hypothetical protein
VDLPFWSFLVYDPPRPAQARVRKLRLEEGFLLAQEAQKVKVFVALLATFL